MPTKKRNSRPRTGTGRLSEDEREWLIDGWCLDNGPDSDSDADMPFPNPEAARQAWEAHRTELIAESRSRGRPIPEGWWKFEATEGLEQIAGPAPLQPVTLWHGEPRMWRSYEDAKSAKFETVAEYCRRLNINFLTLRRKP